MSGLSMEPKWLRTTLDDLDCVRFRTRICLHWVGPAKAMSCMGLFMITTLKVVPDLVNIVFLDPYK
jgi:hypothetical protein